MDTAVNGITQDASGCLSDACWGRTKMGKGANHPINPCCTPKWLSQNVKWLFSLAVVMLWWFLDGHWLLFSSGTIGPETATGFRTLAQRGFVYKFSSLCNSQNDNERNNIKNTKYYKLITNTQLWYHIHSEKNNLSFLSLSDWLNRC